MKKIILLSVLVSSNVFAQMDCSVLKGCANKSCNISNELEVARAHKNNAKIKGLEIALKEVKNNCTESTITQDRQDKIQKYKEKILDLEADLTKARLNGKKDKMAKLEAKVEEAKAELKKFEDNK